MSAMPPEWSARSLLARFAVYGHFYEREAGGALWQLRDRLEIFEHALPWEHVRDGNADMVAVMMNPGASRPLADPDVHGWCPAVPDRTQYQLMRLTLAAAALGAPRIRHIRVINLSDLRTPKSAQLFATLPHAPGWHSIFDPSRRDELQRALGAAATPVLRAWGMAPQLRPLAGQALCRSAPTCKAPGCSAWPSRWRNACGRQINGVSLHRRLHKPATNTIYNGYQNSAPCGHPFVCAECVIESCRQE